MIKLKAVSKFFGSVRAVDSVSFEVGKGEVVGLLGPNGAGKTTTMRLITGFLPVTSGEIEIDGCLVDGSKSVRSKIGYLPENTPLYHDLEVRETLEYFAILRNISKREIPSRINKVSEMCGLSDVMVRPVGQLSKGYRQRVGLAIALIHEPPILILDEPTSGLDPNQIVEIRNLIREIGAERTVVLSTHIMQEVEAVCQRAIIIDKGKLVGQGSLAELKSGRGGVLFKVTVRGARAEVEAKLNNLDGFKLIEISEGSCGALSLTLEGPADEYAGERIFAWAAKEKLPLSELNRRVMSLEDVFRKLTASV